jgi:L-threonylcarbamoyladenylate synthase
VKSGELIVFPTDTVYGIGCDPFDAGAVSRLFVAKGRESKPVPVLCDSTRWADRLVTLGEEGHALAKANWPGALTIVAPVKMKVPKQVDAGSGVLGVRVPGSALCRELVRLSGHFLIGSSANRSGKAPVATATEAQDAFSESVSLILDGGRLKGAPSTVVRLAGKGIEVLREGTVRVKHAEKDLR